jgi:hypothetical protein
VRGTGEVRFGRLGRLCPSFGLALAVFFAFAVPAHATFPGANGRISFSSYQNGDWDLYSINADGSGVRRITSGPGSDLWSDWSPTANKIAFERDFNNGSPPWEVHTMNADGTGDTLLATGENPAWSPDGQKIAYGRIGYDDQGGGIFVMNADGSSVTKIAPGLRDSLQPDWSPDGSKLVFNVQSPTDPGALYTVNADGTGLTRLPGNDWDFDPSWSPNGDKIAFAGGPGATQPQIQIANPDGTGRFALTTTGGEQPVWSPDGQKIAFTRYDDPSEIYTMNADGSGQLNATNSFPAPASEPDWAALIYPHPQSAGSVQVSLVPAFKQCGPPPPGNPANSDHSPPLGVGSCNPPEPVSPNARVGVSGSGSARYTVMPGDVEIQLLDSDIRTPTGLDYAPSGGADLQVVARLRITDTNNCTPGGCTGSSNTAGTASDLDFGPVPVDCVANGSAANPPGSDCNVTVTANGVSPGSVVAGKLAVVQMFRIRVNDNTNTLFQQQGILAP